HCAEQQMARRTLQLIAHYLLIVAKALRLADRPGELITRAEIEAEADRWANRQPRPAQMARSDWHGSGSPALPVDGSLSWAVCNPRPRPHGPTPRPWPSSATPCSGSGGTLLAPSSLDVGPSPSSSRC